MKSDDNTDQYSPISYILISTPIFDSMEKDPSQIGIFIWVIIRMILVRLLFVFALVRVWAYVS